ncbi:hypothetical protein B6S12_09980 [Helicobacter valdiviensis]|uniref:RNA polymerase sigma-70 region 4 domain-containing protein n=1 Tax=Helicobacter valdiviensis TaxID=1458358 RepID=A0A2W6PKS7_9HELI|nr:sigma factor-like helix-turn-helix DNA-binding protein [Helicobacter valdiviensis]PZT47273.1 hypothetical protein B6S12_09980 [Helicobacter valdiviensis]
MSFEEIGKALNISPSRAYEIYSNALRKLRHPRNLKKWQRILEDLAEINKPQEKDSNTERGEKL